MKIRAIVRVTVEIALRDNWSDKCQLDQVFDQAAVEARNIISQHLATVPNLTVHKKAKVEAVLTEN